MWAGKVKLEETNSKLQVHLGEGVKIDFQLIEQFFSLKINTFWFFCFVCVKTLNHVFKGLSR